MGARDKRPRLNRGSCWTETCRGYNLVMTTPISEGKAKSGGEWQPITAGWLAQRTKWKLRHAFQMGPCLNSRSNPLNLALAAPHMHTGVHTHVHTRAHTYMHSSWRGKTWKFCVRRESWNKGGLKDTAPLKGCSHPSEVKIWLRLRGSGQSYGLRRPVSAPGVFPQHPWEVLPLPLVSHHTGPERLDPWGRGFSFSLLGFTYHTLTLTLTFYSFSKMHLLQKVIVTEE